MRFRTRPTGYERKEFHTHGVMVARGGPSCWIHAIIRNDLVEVA
jgi:hypothetical protein